MKKPANKPTTRKAAGLRARAPTRGRTAARRRTTRTRSAEAVLARLGTPLGGEKVGRDDLAASLTELALRLKGDFDLPPAK